MATRTPTLPAEESREEPSPGPSESERFYRYAVATAIVIGVLVRCYHVLRWDFPLNDGGLFFRMVRDLQANNYRLPEFTTYNNAGIPFGYPPLAMYLAGIVDDLTPFSLMTLFRLLPLLATCGTVVAFFLLARDLLRSRVAIVGAVLMFSLIPRSFIWLLMGGGLTRSFGLLFAILALQQVYRLYTRGGWKYAAGAAVFSAATILSHVETGYFVAFSAVVFWVAWGRSWRSFLQSAGVGAGVLVLTAPWWATVISYHGIEPFRAAQEAGGSFFTDPGVRQYVWLSLARVVATSEPWYPLLGTIGFLGAFVTLVTGRWQLVPWWVATIVFDPRAFPTLSSVPVALLGGIGIAEVVLPVLLRLTPGRLSSIRYERGPFPGSELDGPRAVFGERLLAPANMPLLVGGAVLFGFALVGSLVTAPGLSGEGVFLKPLTNTEREALNWISENTPQDARFLVIPRSTWEIDREGEWFPVLAGREDVVTVQGFEWVGDNGFRDRQDRYWAAYDCGFHTTSCLDTWLQRYPEARYSYLYMPRAYGIRCCSTLARSLDQDPRYTRVYDDDGGTIWRFDPQAVDTRRR